MAPRMYSLFGIGLVVHLTFVLAIFDIYFTSPVLHNVSTTANPISRLAERVVVFSVDGMRFDSLRSIGPETNSENTPYLNWIIKSRSTWGVSHTHLPTESRPGHVAMLAGFYEDPSAVTKGWKENPVDFDSIFKQSVCSFAWGSPDIINIFYKGLQHNCSLKWTYNENQDFAGNTMDLDNWVLDAVKSFFQSELHSDKYKKPKSLFFLHLLGQDTSGHTHKPNSELYRQNLRNVDSIVRETVTLFGTIFPDNKTAFVLTSDHGMTDWGSHGSGDQSETETPIIAWGSGIRIQKSAEPSLEIQQADIVPLLSFLIGIPIPVNSRGILPRNILNMSNLDLAEAMFVNAQQINAQYLAKQREIRENRIILPFIRFTKLDNDLIESIRFNLKQGLHAKSISQSADLISLSLEGLDFYHNYFNLYIFSILVVCYLLWITIIFLSMHEIDNFLIFSKTNLSLMLLISMLFGAVIYLEKLPVTYHLYINLCSTLFFIVLPNVDFLLGHICNNLTLKNVLYLFIIIAGVESLVWGFSNRWFHSLSLFAAFIWLLSSVRQKSLALLIFILSGLALTAFTWMPVIGKSPNPSFPLISSSLTALVFFTLTCFLKNLIKSSYIRLFCTLIIGYNCFSVHSNFAISSQISVTNQSVSWLALFISFVLLFEPSSDVINKLCNTFSTLCMPFLLLSISHEAFFLPVLCIHLGSWIKLEMECEEISFSDHYRFARKTFRKESLTTSTARRAFAFLTYTFVAFFGIGTLATINSFDPAWVRCFITTFAPFTMTCLILLKVIIPFFAVTLTLQVLTRVLNISSNKVFSCVLIYLNIMGLNFLFLVTNKGSWLDIGTSLSHYIIQQVTILFLLSLFFVSQLVLSVNVTEAPSKFHLL